MERLYAPILGLGAARYPAVTVAKDRLEKSLNILKVQHPNQVDVSLAPQAMRAATAAQHNVGQDLALELLMSGQVLDRELTQVGSRDRGH